MNQYNQQNSMLSSSPRSNSCGYYNFRPRFGGPYNNHGNNSYGAATYFSPRSQQHFNAPPPPFLQRYGPPPILPAPPYNQWHFPRLPPRVINSPRSNLYSPPPAIASTSDEITRPRGPRTPSDPPPSSPELDRRSPVSIEFERKFSPICSPKRKSHKQKKKERHNKQKHRKQQHKAKKIKKRRHSCPIQSLERTTVGRHNSCSPTNSNKSSEEPSPLNSAVQAYLLQVLTSQPPLGLAQQAEIPSMPMPTLVPPPPPSPPKSVTPPPLPPSPMHTGGPPPSPHIEDTNQAKKAELCTNVETKETTTVNREKVNNCIAKETVGENLDIQEMGNDKITSPLVTVKTKRKKMSTRNGSLKDWTMEEALKALEVEQELSKRVNKDTILYLRFPDPPLTREIVKNYSPDNIESVHFQQNSSPRFCFVHLREGVDVDKIIESLSKIPFGTGFIKAELRQLPPLKLNAHVRPENVDPFTLYVGNLSTSVPCRLLREHFPGAIRIDIGFAQRMKYTRYAFIRYDKVEESIAAYRRMLNADIDGRSIILRFRRIGPVQKDGELDNSSVSIEDEEQNESYSLLSNTRTISSSTTETFDPPSEEGVTDKSEFQLPIKDKVAECLAENVSDLGADKKQDHAIGESSEMIGVPKMLEKLPESEISDQYSQDIGINHVLEPQIPIDEDDLEGEVSDMVSQQQKETAGAEIEHVSTENIENSTSMAAPSTSMISIRDDIDADVMVPKLNTDSVKSEPNTNIDEDDIVRCDAMPKRNYDIEVKEEQFNLDDDFEFFSGGIRHQNQSEAQKMLTETECISAEPVSSDTNCSLSQFLRLCENSRDASIDVDTDTAPPPSKRSKSVDSLKIITIETRATSSMHTEVKEENNDDDNDDDDEDLMLLRQSLKAKENAMLQVKQESNVDTIDEDILIIDSDDYLLATINGDKEEDEFISQPPLANKPNHSQGHTNTVATENPRANVIRLKRQNDATKLPIRPLLLKEEPLESKANNTCGNVAKSTPSIVTGNTEINRAVFVKSTRGEDKTISTKRKSPILPPSDNDDDLVPENNNLCSRQSSIAYFDLTSEDEPVISIKSEIETEDLFSLPKNVDRRKLSRRDIIKTNSELKREALRGNVRRKQLMSYGNDANNRITSAGGSTAINDDDDDVVIIADDTTPYITNVTHSLNTFAELCAKRETPSPASSTVESLSDFQKKSAVKIEKSFFGKRRTSHQGDNLDRIFELLNSDSEEDL